MINLITFKIRFLCDFLETRSVEPEEKELHRTRRELVEPEPEETKQKVARKTSIFFRYLVFTFIWLGPSSRSDVNLLPRRI